MELMQIILSMLGLTIFLIVSTLLISYVIYRVKQNSKGTKAVKIAYNPGIRNDFRAGPVRIHPEINFRIADPLLYREENHFTRHSASPNRFRVVNYLAADARFNAQYFVPKEWGKVA